MVDEKVYIYLHGHCVEVSEGKLYIPCILELEKHTSNMDRFPNHNFSQNVINTIKLATFDLITDEETGSVCLPYLGN